MLRRLVLVALIFAGALTLARADVYRWVDERGVPHYSDQWVPGSEVIRTNKAHPQGADAAAHAADQKSLAASNQRIANQLGDQDNARAVQDDKSKRREALCKQFKDSYMQAITSKRIYKGAGSDGDRSYLSDDEADKYREGLRKSVQENCGSVPQFDPNAPIPEPQPTPEPKVNPADATSR
jgi:Domain of unknown function (DUF4124)